MRLTLRGVPVVYDAQAKTLTCAGQSAPLPPIGGRIRLRILVDRTSSEIFGNDDCIYMPIGVIPKDDDTLALSSKGGEARIHSLTAHEVRSV